MARRSTGKRQAFLIGWVSGSRASFGPTAVTLAHGKPPSKVRTLRSVVGLISAMGELIVDKLPITPSRLEPEVLGGRLASGAVAAVALARRRGDSPLPAAGFGAAGALAGAVVGNNWRRLAAKRGPDWRGALVEDAVTALIAWRATRVITTMPDDVGSA